MAAAGAAAAAAAAVQSNARAGDGKHRRKRSHCSQPAARPPPGLGVRGGWARAARAGGGAADIAAAGGGAQRAAKRLVAPALERDALPQPLAAAAPPRRRPLDDRLAFGGRVRRRTTGGAISGSAADADADADAAIARAPRRRHVGGLAAPPMASVLHLLGLFCVRGRWVDGRNGRRGEPLSARAVNRTRAHRAAAAEVRRQNAERRTRRRRCRWMPLPPTLSPP